MDQRIYRFFTGYGYGFAFLGILLIFSFSYISKQTDTSGIAVSGDKTRLICDPAIKIYKGENAADFLKNGLLKYEGISFKSMICTVDKLYDGTETDQKAVLNFVDKKLSFWPVRRKDIEAYFLQKVRTQNSQDQG